MMGRWASATTLPSTASKPQGHPSPRQLTPVTAGAVLAGTCVKHWEPVTSRSVHTNAHPEETKAMMKHNSDSADTPNFSVAFLLYTSASQRWAWASQGTHFFPQLVSGQPPLSLPVEAGCLLLIRMECTTLVIQGLLYFVDPWLCSSCWYCPSTKVQTQS